MIAVEKIAEVMHLNRPVRSLDDLACAVSHGLPKSALRACVDHIFDTPKQQRELLYRIVPEATYKRRRKQLKTEESERTERLARVIATAEYVWDDTDEAKRFLTTPHSELRGKKPIDAALSELGARQVEELLWKVYYGLPA